MLGRPILLASFSVSVLLIVSLGSAAVAQKELVQFPNFQQRLVEEDISRDFDTWRQIVGSKLQDAKYEWSRTGWGAAIKNYVVEFLPFVSWYRQAQALQDRPTDLSHWVMGETISSNISYVYATQPLKERVAVLNRALEYFSQSGNPLDAITFLSALQSYSTNDRYLSNMSSLFKLFGLPLIGLFVVRKMGRTGMLKNFVTYLRQVQGSARNNCVLLGTIALAVLIIGFLASEGYSSYFGILGSLPHMEISVGPLVVPYKLVAASSILLLLYAGFLFINNRQGRTK
jgi:hypothetical protein